jgi:hypothetical protein
MVEIDPRVFALNKTDASLGRASRFHENALSHSTLLAKLATVC